MKNKSLLPVLLVLFVAFFTSCQGTSDSVGTSSSTTKRKKSKSVSPSLKVTGGEVSDKVSSAKAETARYDDVEAEVEEIAVAKSATPNDAIQAGKLTAGILNDFGKWELWEDITANQLKEWKSVWGIHPKQRYPLQLTTDSGFPVVNAKVRLMKSGKAIWTARTDNTGKAELWANLYENFHGNKFVIEIEYQEDRYFIQDVKTFHEGGNIKSLPVECEKIKKVDIAFVVDATSSMSDEINYLKYELTDVIERSKKELNGMQLNVGSVFYRDEGDDYLTRKSDFSSNINKTVEFIQEQDADGGGDYPEGVEDALEVTIGELKWRDDAAARIIFLVLDAPSHDDRDTKRRIRRQVQIAALKGIRIVPVMCSGNGRSAEYIMRSIALATNGSYIYLTDDSGLGGSHTKPITDEHKVVLLNDLLVETITNFATTTNCTQPTIEPEMQDTVQEVHTLREGGNNIEKELSWSYYPNPTIDILNVKVEGKMDYIYFADAAGKILKRIPVRENELIQINVAEYPAGIYYLKGLDAQGGKDISGKVILIRA